MTAVSWNLVLSGLSGLTLLVGGLFLGPPLGVPAGLLIAIGVGLLAFAGGLFWLLQEIRHLLRGARMALAADLAWVAGAIALLATAPGALSPAGRVVLGVVTAAVAAIAAGQAVGLHRARSGPVAVGSPFCLVARRDIPVAPAEAWRAVSNAGDYARFARGIASTEVVSGAGRGMVRSCADARGSSWREVCTSWVEGSRYRMSVDIDTYPLRYRMLFAQMAQTWIVEPADLGSRVTLSFEGIVRMGVLGRVTVHVLGRPRRLGSILEAYARDLTTG
ncbi:MAG: SRPBCC family protein [Thermoleophilia bacterium]